MRRGDTQVMEGCCTPEGLDEAGLVTSGFILLSGQLIQTTFQYDSIKIFGSRRLGYVDILLFEYKKSPSWNFFQRRWQFTSCSSVLRRLQFLHQRPTLHAGRVYCVLPKTYGLLFEPKQYINLYLILRYRRHNENYGVI